MKKYASNGWWTRAFQNELTGYVTKFDPRADWEKLKVDEDNASSDADLAKEGKGSFKRPVSAYINELDVRLDVLHLM